MSVKKMYLWHGDSNDWRLFDNPLGEPQGYSADFTSISEALKFAKSNNITVIYQKGGTNAIS